MDKVQELEELKQQLADKVSNAAHSRSVECLISTGTGISGTDDGKTDTAHGKPDRTVPRTGT